MREEIKISQLIEFLEKTKDKHGDLYLYVDHRCSIYLDVFTNHSEYWDIKYLNVHGAQPLTFDSYLKCEERFWNKL